MERIVVVVGLGRSVSLIGPGRLEQVRLAPALGLAKIILAGVLVGSASISLAGPTA